MCQDTMNSLGYAGNNYAELKTTTAIGTIQTANPNLNGTGAMTTVATGNGNGTIIKSVIIKATVPVTTGMIRLFIEDTQGTTKALFKEIPVATTPSLNATPTPAPVLPMFEVMLSGGLKLAPGNKLSVSTQNGQTFNVIVEGFDWTYPATLPTVCCNFKQETATTGVTIITDANEALDGSGPIKVIYASDASSNGSVVKAITIKALQDTNEGMVRLFISDDGSKWSLMKEIYIPQTSQSSFDPSYKQVITDEYNLAPGYFLGASTQLSQSFGITVEGTDWVYGI